MKVDANGVRQFVFFPASAHVRFRFDEWTLIPRGTFTIYTRAFGNSRPHVQFNVVWLFAILEIVFNYGDAPEWTCLRCKADVVDGRCKCTVSPSPWAPKK